MNFFRQLFLSGGFQPHGYCYQWNSGLVWLNVVSDALIALAYFTIPLTLLRIIRKRRDLPFSWMFALFGVFIIACGTTHVMEVWNLWHAQYWLAGAAKAVTAAASISTAALLVLLTPEAIRLPSSSQWTQAKTELAKESEERRQGEEKFRLFVLGVKDYAILMLDPEGRVTAWNDGAEHIKGYRADEIIGEHFSRFYTAEAVAQDRPSQELKIASEVGRFEEEGWRVRKDGSLFWANVVITALLDKSGQLRGYGKVTRDITERKKANEALKESEERLQMAVEAAQFGVWDLDLISDRAFRSLRHDRIFGYESLQPVWNAEIAERHILPEDRERFRSSFAEAFKSNDFFTECRINRTADHSVRWICAQGRVYRDSSGKPARMMGVVSDTTDRKRGEQELSRTNSELAAANNELESFSYSVSHDLRAPLRTIDGFSHALLEDCGDRLDETGKTHLNRIRAATQRMGMLIDDLLNLSRLSRTEMHTQSVDISAMAFSVAGDLQKSEPERHIELCVEHGLKTTADPGLLRAVLENLLSNAWKFTSKRASARIEFGLTHEDGALAYFVKDDGAGFDPAYADRLFGAFQRLHSMSEFAGTGVGLATVQRIVHRHGGRIWAKSAVDQGATFYFTLNGAAS